MWSYVNPKSMSASVEYLMSFQGISYSMKSCGRKPWFLRVVREVPNSWGSSLFPKKFLVLLQKEVSSDMARLALTTFVRERDSFSPRSG